MFMSTNDVLSTLKAAIRGHQIEHGVPPTFILMSGDMGRALRAHMQSEVNVLMQPGENPNPAGRMTFDGIEVGQVAGVERIELVADLAAVKTQTTAS